MSANPIRLTVKTQTRDDLTAKLRAHGRTKIVEAGTSLYQQSDICTGVYVLIQGLIGLRKLDEDGDTMLVNLVRDGDFFGYGPMQDEGEHETSAEVLKTSEVLFIDLGVFQRLLREIPGLMPRLLRQATRDLTMLENKYLQIATCQAHERLAALLLSFETALNGCLCQGSCSFQLPLLNKDIADLIGIRPETLSRAIGHLKSAGLVEFTGRSVRIPNVAKLCQVGRPARYTEMHGLAA